MCLYDVIVEELIEKKSLAALIYLIDCGRDLEFTFEGEEYFISRDNSPKYVSLWQGENEQSFDSVSNLIENATIGNRPLLSVWNLVEIQTLF